MEDHVHLTAQHLVPHCLHDGHRGAAVLVPGVGVVRRPSAHVAVEDSGGGPGGGLCAGQRGHLEEILAAEVVRDSVPKGVVDAGVGQGGHACERGGVDEPLLPPASGVGGRAGHLVPGEGRCGGGDLVGVDTRGGAPAQGGGGGRGGGPEQVVDVGVACGHDTGAKRLIDIDKVHSGFGSIDIDGVSGPAREVVKLNV